MARRKAKSNKKKKGFSFFKFFLIIFLIAIGAISYLIYDKFKNIDFSEKIQQVKAIGKKKLRYVGVDIDDDKDSLIVQKKVVKQVSKKPIKIDKKSNTNRDLGYVKSITTHAKKYEGLPVSMGMSPDKDKATDNSHLFHAILKNAAIDSGKKYPKYMTMTEILKNSQEIQLSELQNGDFIVLKSGMMAMLFGFENRDKFYYIYASSSKSKVVVQDSQFLRQYWFPKKKGFYRLKPEIFTKL